MTFIRVQWKIRLKVIKIYTTLLCLFTAININILIGFLKIIDANVQQPGIRLRGKRKNVEVDEVERQEMDIRRRVHHIVRNLNPHTFPNGKSIVHDRSSIYITNIDWQFL